MALFQEKIIEKKENDRRLYDESLDNILSLTKNSGSGIRYGSAFLNELESVFLSLGVKLPAIPAEITDPENILLYAMSLTGVMRRKITLSGKWWKEASMPLLCTETGGDTFALIPSFGKGYTRKDCKTGRANRFGKKEAAGCQKTAYCFYKPLKNDSLRTKDFFLGILSVFTPGDALLFLFISLFVSLLGLVLPAINRMIFNDVIPSGSRADIWGVASLLIGSGLVSALFTAVRSAVTLRLGNKTANYVQNAVWARLFTLQADIIKKYDAEDLTQRANAASELCEVLTNNLLPVFFSLLFSFIYMFQISAYTPSLFWLSLLILLLLLASIVLSGYLRYKHYSEKRTAYTRLSSLTYQLFSGIVKIKLAGSEIRSFNKWSVLYAKSAREPKLFVIIYGAVITFLQFGGLILLYNSAVRAGVAASDYIAFTLAFGAVTAALIQLSGVSGHISRIKPLINQLRPILEAKPETDAAKETVTSLQGRIEINQISFRYNEDMPLVLNNLSLTVEPGEYLAVTGSSGCGKSTLIRLLLGFETPVGGAIYYDGHDLQESNLRSIRRRIGVVLQNGKLFSGSIYSNIVICAPWLTLDDAWAAAEQAGLAEDIRNMPMGMFTMISENGGISGGQKQRLLIARALAAKPDILIFDEATSALDNITQAQVVDTLSKMKITRIVIAHRLSTIRGCDKIVYLNKGRVAESGTYDELIKKDGLFAAMAERQLL